jgi:hypothetical protein
MNQGQIVFAQVMQHAPLSTFRRCVERHGGGRRLGSFSCLDQFYCMAFAQLTYRESLRDIEVNLRAHRSKLYHMGFRSNVSRNTLAQANASLDWRVHADFAQHLIAIARELYADEPFGVELSETVYALDATIIDLCLSVFPWARYKTTDSAIKLHALLDLRGSIPAFLSISDGKLHDVKILDELALEPGAIYVMDRGYLDARRLFQFHEASSFFVIRSKSNTQVKRRYSREVDRTTGLICDPEVVFAGRDTALAYRAPFRRIRFKDPVAGRTFVFFTNSMALPALTVTQIYRCRWQVELFFKWIKQHLRIKAF